MDWFERLTGFKESSYAETRQHLAVKGTTLVSKINGKSYEAGELETPALAELRARAAAVLERTRGELGELTVASVVSDVRQLHRDPANRHALFQVASQFNLLEMVGPGVTPEDGVTRYAQDHTQGPACAIAAGAATIYRNYFAPVDGQHGQTSRRQIDCLRDVGAALGNQAGSLWEMRNGYALCTRDGLAAVDGLLKAMTPDQIDALRDKLRIGLHWRVEATEAAEPGWVVSQAFCSALPVSYAGLPHAPWAAFATLVLEGAYEATLWAAVLNAHRFGSPVVFLTQLGGGAFGNDFAWIQAALRRALRLVEGLGLDVRIVSYGSQNPALVQLAKEFG